MQSVSRKVITYAHQEAVEDLAGEDIGANPRPYAICLSAKGS